MNQPLPSMNDSENHLANKRRSIMPMIVVLATVVINVSSGIVLKTLADQINVGLLVIFALIGIVLFLNGLRFLVWTYAHRKYPLSTTYPLTSLFFPVMLGVAYFYGDPIGPGQWIGTIFITAGVFWLSWKVPA